MNLVAILVRWLTGDVTQALSKAYQAKLEAETQEDKLAAEQRIELLKAKQSILIAEQAHGSTRWIRPAFATIFVIYIAKVVVWDKVLGWGATDPLSPELTEIMMIILSAYFIGRPIEKVVKYLKCFK